MKKTLVSTLVIVLLIVPIFSAIGSYNQQNELENNQSSNYLSAEIPEDTISVIISPAPGSIGVYLEVTNSGTEVVEDVEWSFRTKPVIFGGGFLVNEKIRKGMIEQIQPDETITLNFRPFRPNAPSPFGFANLYMNATIQTNDVFIRTQQKAMVALFFIINYKDTYIDIPPSEAYSKYLNGTFDLIIDVVGLDIYDLGHLPGAVNYVWADGTLADMIPTLDENLTYLVYCHTDPPSTASAQAVVNAGIKNTYRLEGNYRSWVDAGYPTETS